jgi:1,4-alpha-glucan branching enzyme
MLFMGQEILEDKNWSDNPKFSGNSLIWWDGLASNPAMRDFMEFIRALLKLRGTFPSLTEAAVNVFHVNNSARVIAFHRWSPGVGNDLVVVGTLSETNINDYRLGFPITGVWREVFNSDFFESAADHQTTGNGGRVAADNEPLHGMPACATITIPANGVLMFAR